ncbi:MAG: hypothetical protein Q7K45_06855 [Nanoarchaeota archaeon]|nr:hypothetical protein [Nanoarchaeota archaeon]
MNQHLQHYVDSLKVKKVFWITFLVDFIFFGAAGIAFSKYLTYLQNTSLELVAGRTPEQIQQLIATTPEQALPFLEGLKSFLLVSIGTLLLLAIITFLLFSLEQAFIWNTLQQKKVTSKTYWRWNLLYLGLIIPLLLYGLGAGIVKLVTSSLLRVLGNLNPSFYFQNAALVDGIILALNNAVSFILVLFALLIIFLICSTFTEKYKVWSSISEGLSKLKPRWSVWWRMVLLMTATAIIITFIVIPLRNALFIYPFLESVLNVVVSFLFLAWMRIYVVSALHHGHQ